MRRLIVAGGTCQHRGHQRLPKCGAQRIMGNLDRRSRRWGCLARKSVAEPVKPPLSVWGCCSEDSPVRMLDVPSTRPDLAYATQTNYSALETAPSGTTYEWHNPDSGNSGATTPTQTYQTTSGAYCREFTQTVNVGGEIQDAYGTACRQPDGSWKISG